MPHYLFKKKGPGFCNIFLHIDRKFTSRMRIACLPNASRISTYIHGYSTKMAKSMARHGLLSLNYPPKIPTYEASTYQKGSSFIDARLFRPNLFLQSFTFARYSCQKTRRKTCFRKIHRPISSPVTVLASFCRGKRMHLRNHCPATAKL